MSSLVGKQAVVVGAGMGGLAAAGAIARALRAGGRGGARRIACRAPTHRPGIPQGRERPPGCGRQRPARAQRALPLISSRTLCAPAPYPVRFRSRPRAGRTPATMPFPRRDLGLAAYALSRPAIEHAVRRRVEGLANVRLRQRCRVGGIAGDTGWRDGCGRPLRQRERLEGNARGRSRHRRLRAWRLSRSLCWESIGRPLTEETTIRIDLGYATCVFAIPDDAPTHWKGVMTFGGQAPRSCPRRSDIPARGQPLDGEPRRPPRRRNPRRP